MNIRAIFNTLLFFSILAGVTHPQSPAQTPSIKIINKLHREVEVWVTYFTKSTKNDLGQIMHFRIPPSGFGDKPASSEGDQYRYVAFDNEFALHNYRLSIKDDPLTSIVSITFLYQSLPSSSITYINKKKRITLKKKTGADLFGWTSGTARTISVGWSLDDENLEFQFENLDPDDAYLVD